MGTSKEKWVELVGLIPAGGKSTRVSPLPCSKEIFPVGFASRGGDTDIRPKVAAQYLLDSLHAAGTKRAFFILRQGKWDIPAYFGSGLRAGMPIGYLMVDGPHGVPYTLDSAFSFVGDKPVAFGFPDILFEPQDAFVQLLARQRRFSADLVLGLFPAVDPQKNDMVDLDGSGRVRAIEIKPQHTELEYTWIIAVWTVAFTRFMHHFVARHRATHAGLGKDGRLRAVKELFVGDVIQAAIGTDLKIDHVIFNTGSYIDIGTPEDMLRAASASMAPFISAR